jgi:integrative and conjugative element protein (TIGR02256 family)
MRIHLAPEIVPRLRKELSKAGSREIGGMLFAEQLKPAKFCIIDFSVDAKSGTHASFQRDPALHRQELDRFFDRTDHEYRRFNYLGEWHSHPSFSVRPSAQDVQSMTEVVSARHSNITFAVLLIVRLRWRLWIDHSLTVFAKDQRSAITQLSPRRTRN